MQWNKKMLLAAGLLLLYNALLAQADPLACIDKIYGAYKSNHVASFNGAMKMYTKSNPQKIIETMQSSYTMKGANCICRIGPVLMLLNENYYVSVDNTLKLLVIGYRKGLSSIDQQPVLNIGRFKALLHDKSIEAAVINNGALRVLQLTDTHNVTGYSFCSIAYNPVTGYLKKVVMETSDYNDEAHKTMVLEIDYTAPVPVGESKSLFSEKPFFSINNNKVRVADNYRTYQLINQL